MYVMFNCIVRYIFSMCTWLLLHVLVHRRNIAGLHPELLRSVVCLRIVVDRIISYHFLRYILIHVSRRNEAFPTQLMYLNRTYLMPNALTLGLPIRLICWDSTL